jgi:GT2 family glycosyltransferase
VKKIITIIVAYNGERYIRRCLECLRNSRGSEHNQILVIDNDSSDLTCEIIENEFPEVELIRSNKNLGFGKANNIGLREVLKRGIPYAFLLNQDAYADENLLRKLLQIAEANPDYGILSPMQLNGRGDGVDFKFSRYCLTPELKEALETYPDAMQHVYPTYFTNAAAWFIPRSFLEKVGGFAPMFPHYGEDNDLINRCHFHGFKVGILPEVSIRHDRTQTLPDAQKKTIDQAAQDSLIRNLIILSNVNSRFGPALFLAVKRSVRFVVIGFKLRNIAIEWRGWYRICTIWSKIRRTRKLCRQGGAVFLREEES